PHPPGRSVRARMTTGRDPKKFDPARAHVLDAPERERFLPTDQLVAMLELRGDERVVDYGAGTGRLTFPVAEALTRGGEVLAVDESEEMYERLVARAGGAANVAVAVEAARPPQQRAEPAPADLDGLLASQLAGRGRHGGHR